MAEITSKKTHWSYIIGIVFIAAGFLTSALNAYFLMIGFIFFFIGAVLVFISKKTVRVKTLTILIPVILFFSFYYIMYRKSIMEPAVYVIPASYRGEVNIIFNEACGEETKYRNGRRLYVIPPSGILFTKFKQEYGVSDNEYYLSDSLGHETRIVNHGIDEFEPGGSSVNKDDVFTINIGNGDFSTDNEKPAILEKFMVCSYNDIKAKYNDKYEKVFDHTLWELLNKCRARK